MPNEADQLLDAIQKILTLLAEANLNPFERKVLRWGKLRTVAAALLYCELHGRPAPSWDRHPAATAYYTLYRKHPNQLVHGCPCGCGRRPAQIAPSPRD